MLSIDLFRQLLLDPAVSFGMDRLQIVTGFATANLADMHMHTLKKKGRHVAIDLIIGMGCSVGIEKAQHMALKELAVRQPYDMNFNCRYVVRGNPVHANTYCWLKNGQPEIAFNGSANYTMNAFGRSRIETMTEDNADEVNKFHREIKTQTISCVDKEIESNILFTEKTPATNEINSVTLSLLSATGQTGETPKRSGINWGQRPNRNKDQAYINIPADIGRSGFFPERAEQFTVLTDDGYTFIMVRAQDGGKSLETTENNSILGNYLRKRIGLYSGEFVTRKHLVEYGRTDVSFTKIDEETYGLDFRPNLGPGQDEEIWQENSPANEKEE